MPVPVPVPVPPFVTAKQADIAALCRPAGARSLDLFGSAERGDFDPLRSDLDFVVELDELAMLTAGLKPVSGWMSGGIR